MYSVSSLGAGGRGGIDRRELGEGTQPLLGVRLEA